MTFTARRLTSDAVPEIQRIVMGRSQMGLVPISVSDASKTAAKICFVAENYFENDLAWGAYDEDGKLCSFLCQVLPRSLDDWLMPYLSVSPHIKTPWNYAKNGLDECWQAAFDYAEARGYNAVRWSLPVAWSKTQKRTAKTSSIWKNYTIDTYAIVKAGTVPVNMLDAWVAGNVKPYDVALKRATRCAS